VGESSSTSPPLAHLAASQHEEPSSWINQACEYRWKAQHAAGSRALCAAETADHGPPHTASRGETGKASNEMRRISNNLTYSSCDGQLDIEDQDGQVIRLYGTCPRRFAAERRDGSMPIPADSTLRRCRSSGPPHAETARPVVGARAACNFAKWDF
jgi:hypothetical protein